MEQILEITERDDGYEVKTTEQSIVLTIDQYSQCCEETGYFWTNDNPQDFIGAELREVTLTDDCLITEKAPDIYEGGVMYVNLETNRGTLQFTAYNEHNGYYSHEAKVECKQISHSEYL